MFCSNCGKEINDNLGYCPDCQNNKTQKQPSKSHKLFKSICAVFLLIIIVPFFFGLKNKTNTSPENDGIVSSEEYLDTISFSENNTDYEENLFATTEIQDISQTIAGPDIPLSKPTEVITFDTIMEYDYIILYDFEKEKSVGATEITDDIIDFKGLYGLQSVIQNNELSYNYYRNSLSASEAATIELHQYGEKKPFFQRQLKPMMYIK